MLYDLQYHELEVVKAFFKRGMAWAESESELESAQLATLEQPDEEFVESLTFSPHGSLELERIIIRAVLNELNSLCEFALQKTWIQLSGNQLELPDGTLVVSANRGDIEKALRNKDALGDRITDVSEWPNWLEIKKIKELSEGFKHRQRLQPFTGEFQSSRNQRRCKRLVDPDNANFMAEYELSAADVTGYIDAVEKLFSWLDSKSMLSIF